MSTRHASEAVAHDRPLALLCACTGATREEVRALFAQELARLEAGATVRSYLPVLAAANVRALLRCKSHSRNAVGHEDMTMHHLTAPIAPIAKRLSAWLRRLWKRPKANRAADADRSQRQAALESWEDEGGTARHATTPPR